MASCAVCCTCFQIQYRCTFRPPRPRKRILFISCRKERSQPCAQTDQVSGMEGACGEYHQATPTTVPTGMRMSSSLLLSFAARVIFATEMGQSQLIPYWKWAAREAAFRWMLNCQTLLLLGSTSTSFCFMILFLFVCFSHSHNEVVWVHRKIRYLIPWMDHQTPSENRDHRQTLSAHSLQHQVCRSQRAGRFRLTLFLFLVCHYVFLDSDNCS